MVWRSWKVALFFSLLIFFFDFCNGGGGGKALRKAKVKKLDKPPPSPYLKDCSFGNLLIATRELQHRYAYGLTMDCTFFFFDMKDYNIVEKALDFLQAQHDAFMKNGNEKLCPAEKFSVRYASKDGLPYFEVVEPSTTHYITYQQLPVYFAHISTKGDYIGSRSKFNSTEWTTNVEDLILNGKPRIKDGRHEIRTYIRHKPELPPGACIGDTFSAYNLFQIRPLIGAEVEDLLGYVKKGIPVPEDFVEPDDGKLYFSIINAMIGLAAISILISIGLIIWKLIEFFSLEKSRAEIEKFVVACYVEKLEKFSNGPNDKPKKSKRKKKTKREYTDTETEKTHYHRRRKCRSYSQSVSKMPHGSKLIPIPNENDLFASDKKKVEVKPAAVQEARKTTKNLPSVSVCSLKSITTSVDGSTDWTGKGVRVSQRKAAADQLKEDKVKDEDEAYKLGLNLSTYKRKKKRQQHGLSTTEETEKEKKLENPPMSATASLVSVVRPPSSFQKPPTSLQKAPTSLQKPPASLQKTPTSLQKPPTSLQKPPASTTSGADAKPKAAAENPAPKTKSQMLRGDAAAKDEDRFKRAEEQLRMRAAQKGSVSLVPKNNNPYGSLIVPPEEFVLPQKPKTPKKK